MSRCNRIILALAIVLMISLCQASVSVVDLPEPIKISDDNRDNADGWYEEAQNIINSGDDSGMPHAVELLEQAAASGHAESLYYLGHLYERGDTVPRNLTTAIEFYNRSAILGNDQAQFALGFLYETGVGVPQDDAKALIYYNFAAIADNLEAQLALAFRFMHGIGVPRKCQMAADYYRMVALKVITDPDRQGVYPLENTHLYDVDSDTSQSQSHLEEVVEYYDQLATQGDSNAQSVLGQLHFYGQHGVQRDAQRALHYFEAAAGQGDPTAMANLGHMYAQGIGVERNETAALDFYRKAADRNSPAAWTGLGYMYMNGLGVPQHYETAFGYFSRAAKEGNPNGQYNLAFMFLHGLGTQRDYRQALTLFHAAAHQHHTSAMFQLAEMYLAGLGTPRSCSQALPFFKSVAERGDWSEVLSHALDLHTEEDHVGALWFFQRAATLGYEMAQSNAAYMLQRAQGCEDMPQEERYKHALRLYSLAAEQHNLHALVEVGDFHYYGLGTVPNAETAFSYYKRAADGRHPQALFNLGYAHHYGDGAIQDPHLAKRYYDLARAVSRDALVPSYLAVGWLQLGTMLNQMPFAWDTVALTIAAAVLLAAIFARLRHV